MEHLKVLGANAKQNTSTEVCPESFAVLLEPSSIIQSYIIYDTRVRMALSKFRAPLVTVHDFPSTEDRQTDPELI